jgi:peptidyl-prolyl cis-trans isomerase D
MLRGIHKASANWLGRIVMGIILGLIAISFAIWGIGDIFRGFGQSTVAKIGGSEIRIEQFRQLYQERLQQLGRSVGRPILPDQARALGLDRQLLAQLIAETVIDERARALGLGISDAEIARQITENPNFKGITGQFDRSRFDQALRNGGYTEARFLDEQRRATLRQQLVGTVSGEAPMPKTALEAFNLFQNEERSIEFVVLGPAQAGDVPAPTPEALTKYFNERKVLFRAPEYRTITIAILKPEDLVSTIEVSEADLKKAYEAGRARFNTPERRHIKQMVFPNMEEARAAADKLAKGASFEAVATERGLKDSDIDLGTVAKTAIVDSAIADAAFALNAGEASAPVQGRFGIAIVKAESVEPPKTKAFEEVSAELKRQIAIDRAKNELINVQEKVEDERLGGATLVDAARKFNLKPRVIEVDRTGKTPDGKAIDDLPKEIDVLSAAFSAEVNGENEALRMSGDNGYVWFNVDKITASRERAFDEVKEQVVERWRNDQIAERLKAKAGEMIDKIKAGTPFAEVAGASNLKVEWRPGIKRGGQPAGVPASAIPQIFSTAKDAAASVDGAQPTERIVFRVTEIKVPALDPNSAAVKRIDEALRNRISEDLIAQYVARLQGQAGVSINESALNQVTGASTAN